MRAFIIFRDRVTYARRCHASLVAAGFEVHVVDHASTWPAALAWLAELESAGTPVLRRGSNAYPWQLWEWPPFRDLMWGHAEPYLVTDPDVVPSDDCPSCWPGELVATLGNYPRAVKAGLGLRRDRISGRHPQRDRILADEAPFWANAAEPDVYWANIDTTLALYRPWTEYPLFALGPALRLGPPYVADHLGWYEMEPLTPEQAYYREHGDPGHRVPRVLQW